MIRAFFKEYGFVYLLYLGLNGMFLLTFFLYRLPLTYFITSLLINVTLLLMISFYLYWRFYQRLKSLHHFNYVKELKHLDDFHSPIDLAYKTIIENLKQEQTDESLQYKMREENLQQVIKLWSHQMKVPLSALSLMAQTDQLKPDEVQRQLLRLENDLSRLLNYIKFNQNQSDFRFEKCHVRQILIELIKKNQVFFLQKNLSVRIDGDWNISSDKKWLTFVFSQILDNAIKYSKNGTCIKIKIVENQLVIADQGIGILTEDIPRLFDEGFTGYNGHQYQKATGLGLYMAKKILNNLGLTIYIDSQIDQGTQVYITRK